MQSINSREATKVFLILAVMLSLLWAFPPKAYAGTEKTFGAQSAVSQQETTEQAVYPAEIQETEENDYHKIIKTYALSEAESPDNIQRESFERAGVKYAFSDIIRKEHTAEETQEHTETVTITTGTQNIDEILAQLTPTIEYDHDGYIGTLNLDLTTVKTEVAGHKTSTYEVTKTREYPHLSGNDTSLVPKSIEEGGKTYNLADVSFVAQNTNSIDSEEMPTSYKAIAEYSATASSTKVTGYTTTAEYKGIIRKTVTDKIFYSVIFMGEKIIIETPTPKPTVAPTPTPAPQPTEQPLPTPKPAKPIDSSVLSVIALLFTGLLSGAGIATAYFVFGKNTIVYSQNEGKYTKIGRLKISYKKRIADLTRLSAKAPSPKFILELSQYAFKKLKEKNITVKFGEQAITHTVDKDSDMARYQFEANFE